LSDRDIAFFACPADFNEPEAAANLLLGIKRASGARKFLAVVGKYKSPTGVQIMNTEANYPSEFAKLMTLARWALPGSELPAQYHDSRVLVCLRLLATANPGIGRIVILRHSPNANEEYDSLLTATAPRAFSWPKASGQVQADDPAWIVWNRDCPSSDEALNLALDIALSGAIYGLDPYNFTGLLDEVMIAHSAASLNERVL
jgi:hypothetical protein